MRARLLEDCAHNLRIAYRLPVPIDEAFLVRADASEVSVNRFSTFVADAKDHVVAVFDLDPPVRAEASIGDNEIIVTFGSLHGPARPEAVNIIEKRLERACRSAKSR